LSINNLEEFGEQFKALLDPKPEWPQLLENGREMLSQLVSNPDWFKSTLSRLVLDQAFLQAQWQSIDPNDIQIYFSPDKAFSVRAFIWEPGVMYPIHDHGAWGIVGAHINQVRERKFARMDDGLDINHAEVKQITDATLSPGETTFVLPMNNGIHQMQALNNQVAVSIHVYGAPIRKGFIHYFDPHLNTIQRIYPPSIYKKMLAIKTLGSIPEAWAEETLTTALRAPEPDYILKECQYSLDKMKGK
jgi:predicted metal-dependent enzyme (double-stranded beta helix superfamily)